MKFEKYDADGKQLIWDASSFQLLSTCAYKYKLKKKDWWAIEDPAREQAAEWGKAYHECKEVLFREIAKGRSIREAVESSVGRALTFREALSRPEGYSGKWDNARTLDTLVRSLVWYAEEYGENLLRTLILPNGEPALELRFEFHVPNTDYRVSGRIDRVVTDDEGTSPLDFKTTSKMLNNVFFRQFTPNIQVYIYLYICRHVLGFEAPKFIVDGVQVLVGGTRFARSSIYVDDKVLEDFMNIEIPALLEEYDRCWNSGIFPQRFSSCDLFGSCEFRHVCSMRKDLHEQRLKDTYVRRSPKSKSAV